MCHISELFYMIQSQETNAFCSMGFIYLLQCSCSYILKGHKPKQHYTCPTSSQETSSIIQIFPRVTVPFESMSSTKSQQCLGKLKDYPFMCQDITVY